MPALFNSSVSGFWESVRTRLFNGAFCFAFSSVIEHRSSSLESLSGYPFESELFGSAGVLGTGVVLLEALREPLHFLR